MVIIVYAAQTSKSIVANIGIADYSYYFVLEKFRPILAEFAQVIETENPEAEVDEIYEECRSRGEACFYFSFTPPFKALISLKCPSVCVFAWEYATIPTDIWGQDSRNDWRNVFKSHGCAITHSSFAVRTVQKEMGDHFPVWCIPAPLWDEYSSMSSEGVNHSASRSLTLSFLGSFADLNGCRTSSQDNECVQRTFEEWSSADYNRKGTLELDGIIYTAVFNPTDGRKNWVDLVTGFIWAFREVEDAILLLKLTYHDYAEIRDMIVTEILRSTPFKCRIIALHAYLSADEYAGLIQASTYIVNASHGEGQCLPLMEFMSAGKPAIAPRHTAMQDYIDEDNAFIVQSGEEWIHWPHDPRSSMRTLRQRINWESLCQAFVGSYHVVKNDVPRYEKMSAAAVRSLEGYCSVALVRKRLNAILPRYEVYNPNRSTISRRDAQFLFRCRCRLMRAKASLSQTMELRLSRWYLLSYRIRTNLRERSFFEILARLLFKMRKI